MARVVRVGRWTYSGLYDRHQMLEVLKGDYADVGIGGMDYVAMGVRRAFASRRYTLLIDGQARGAVDVAPGSSEAKIRADLTSVAEGWHELGLEGLGAGECCPRWFAYRHINGSTKPEMMPVVTGTFDLYHAKTNRHAWAMVPTNAKPRSIALTRTEFPAFSTTLTRGLLVMDMLVIGYRSELVSLPNVNADGIVNTFNIQGYHYWNLHRKYPVFHLLDGPRGVSQTAMITHITIGVGTQEVDPSSAPMLAVYATDPWRVMRVSNDGTVTTLAGYRHKSMGPYHEDPQSAPTLELVGDWSAIPAARRGFHELWGLAWLASTLTVDETAPRIAAEGNRHPHAGNPACLVTDTQNNRVCRIEFDGRSHATPAKVTEWRTDLSNPWDVVRWRDQYIVGERGSSRIVAYNQDGGILRVVLERDKSRPGSAAITKTQEAEPVGTLAQIQAQPVVAPEGLYVLDDWLYYGSRVMQQVRRVHLVTGEVQVACTPAGAGSAGNRWHKIAVSDGTFGPKGTVFVQTWSNNGTPAQLGYLPDGSRWTLDGAEPWKSNGYGNAVAVGHGRMYVASAEYGLLRYSKKLATDPVIDHALYQNGRDTYMKSHGRLLWGPAGFSPWGLPPPWGWSDAVDYFLTVNGHTR